MLYFHAPIAALLSLTSIATIVSHFDKFFLDAFISPTYPLRPSHTHICCPSVPSRLLCGHASARGRSHPFNLISAAFFTNFVLDVLDRKVYRERIDILKKAARWISPLPNSFIPPLPRVSLGSFQSHPPPEKHQVQELARTFHHYPTLGIYILIYQNTV